MFQFYIYIQPSTRTRNVSQNHSDGTLIIFFLLGNARLITTDEIIFKRNQWGRIITEKEINKRHFELKCGEWNSYEDSSELGWCKEKKQN